MPFLTPKERWKIKWRTIIRLWLPAAELLVPIRESSWALPLRASGLPSQASPFNRIASEKIVEEWQEWDSLGLMQQLGVVPSFKFEAKAA
jgi:hypothetical protein